MADNFREKLSSLSGRLKIGGSGVSRKMSAGMSTMGGKMKGLFQVHTQADKLVEDLTAENLEGPDWSKNIELVDMVNQAKVSGHDVVRAIKKRIMMKNASIQLLALVLLETCLKNCEKMFPEVASERLLDEMVKLVDDRQTPTITRDKVLKLIEAWGEATEELRYLPVFEEIYKSLKYRGIIFPGRDPESLAPIFTPPQTVPIVGADTREVAAAYDQINTSQTKDMFDVARNCMELLSTVLTSSPQQEALHVYSDGMFRLRDSFAGLQECTQEIMHYNGDQRTPKGRCVRCRMVFKHVHKRIRDKLQPAHNKFLAWA